MNNPNRPEVLTIGVNANADRIATINAASRKFSTGSEGFYANGKIEIAGERYQVSMNIVRIGSKPVTQAQ
jgi:hypothetical protein